MIQVEHLTKKLGALTILKDLSFHVPKGSWVSLTGPSGSGKTTLLGMLAGLDRPTQGKIQVQGVSLEDLDEDARARFRAEHMGFVFQSFRLIPHLTALENVAVSLEILGKGDGREAALHMLQRVGLGDRLHHRPSELSGGEQQRVAVARAFVNRPALLLADEPTGNLDSSNGALVLELIRELHREQSSTLIVVTHDPEVARQAEQQIRLKDGEMIS